MYLENKYSHHFGVFDKMLIKTKQHVFLDIFSVHLISKYTNLNLNRIGLIPPRQT